MPRQKRSRTNKDQEGDIYMTVHPDDVPPESYSRPRPSYRVSENYRGPSSSSQASYIPGRGTSRSRHEDDWRHRDLDHNRYPYDGFPHPERGEYDGGSSRNPPGWGTVHSSQYTQSSLDWPHRFDSTASSSSYPKTSTWGINSPTPYDHSRSSFQEHWPAADSREAPLDDWGVEPSHDDRLAERRHSDWPETRRDKNIGPKFLSDSGWESRRRERSNWISESMGRHDSLHAEKRQLTTEDRAWEPAASWKSTSGHDQHQRSQNGQRFNSSRTKRQQTQVKRREWRAADDSDLNK
ncbi:hypothetical protein BDN70DRAFT_988845 [Pholiota conissans]|uniref:Uncharacterized protein n=1 Tax=Pholiota conissans TaxID=109636 RepID=A0A9P5ZDU8_9AGAR|nr:hypothetical protein BDN70DRAFT_988845 [Pholiota conissans]